MKRLNCATCRLGRLSVLRLFEVEVVAAIRLKFDSVAKLTSCDGRSCRCFRRCRGRQCARSCSWCSCCCCWAGRSYDPVRTEIIEFHILPPCLMKIPDDRDIGTGSEHFLRSATHGSGAVAAEAPIVTGRVGPLVIFRNINFT